jgi:hypothetical protein
MKMEQTVSVQGATSSKRFFRAERKTMGILMALLSVCGLIVVVSSLLTIWSEQDKYQRCLADAQQTYAQSGVVVGCDLLKPKPLFSVLSGVSGTVIMALGLLQRWLFLRSSLHISPEGVECIYDFYSYRTAWDNVERVVAMPFGVWRRNLECLTLRDPAADVGGWLTLPSPESYRRVIPLGLFLANWRDGEIGQEIRKYAPHLLA